MTLPNGQMPPTPVPVPGQELVQPVPSTVRVWTIPGPKEAIVAVLIATPLGALFTRRAKNWGVGLEPVGETLAKLNAPLKFGRNGTDSVRCLYSKPKMSECRPSE